MDITFILLGCAVLLGGIATIVRTAVTPSSLPGVLRRVPAWLRTILTAGLRSDAENPQGRWVLVGYVWAGSLATFMGMILIWVGLSSSGSAR
jgi:hypothetical protein